MIFGSVPDFARLLMWPLLGLWVLLLILCASVITVLLRLTHRSHGGRYLWGKRGAVFSVSGILASLSLAVVSVVFVKSEMQSCVSRVVLSLGEPITPAVLRQPEYCKIEVPSAFLSRGVMRIFESIPWYSQHGRWGLFSKNSAIDLTVNYKGRAFHVTGATRVEMSPDPRRDNFQDSILVSTSILSDTLMASLVQICEQLNTFVSEVKQCEVAAGAAMAAFAARRTVVLRLEFASDEMISTLRVVGGGGQESRVSVQISLNTRYAGG